MTAPLTQSSICNSAAVSGSDRCFVVRLVEAREALRWSQAELGKVTGLQPAATSHFECGQRLPSVPNLIRLSKALRVSTDWLLGLTNEKQESGVIIDGVRYYPEAKNHE